MPPKRRRQKPKPPPRVAVAINANAATNHRQELKAAIRATATGLNMLDHQSPAYTHGYEAITPNMLEINADYHYEISRHSPGKFAVLKRKWGRGAEMAYQKEFVWTKEGVLRYVFGNSPVVESVGLQYNAVIRMSYLYSQDNTSALRDARKLRQLVRSVRNAADNPHTEFGKRVLTRRFEAAARENAALLH